MADVIYTESGEQFIVVGNEAVSEIVTEVATYPEVVETITAGPQGAPGSMSNEVSIVAGEAIGGHRGYCFGYGGTWGLCGLSDQPCPDFGGFKGSGGVRGSGQCRCIRGIRGTFMEL